MSTKNLEDEEVDSEEEEDEDYVPPNDEDEENPTNQSVEEEEKQVEAKITPYDESKTDALWKNFTSSSSTVKETVENPKPTNQIFDYAGEKVSVPVPATTSLKRPAAATNSNSVLDRLGIGKKQKLSTLEKSRLDWSVHKTSESLNDDLDSHRRGKDSYVEKKAFLQRSEAREHDHYLIHVKKK